MTNSFPTVSVIMIVHNEMPYLSTAVESILNQTFDDFEFIIINDGSTDGSKELLDKYEQHDSRIKVVHQGNQGVPASKNRALKMSKGEYIALMDGDDISHSKRLETQVHFMEEHSHIGILGTQLEMIDSKGDLLPWGWDLPTEADAISWNLLFNNCIAQPSILMRHSIINNIGGYNEVLVAEDYELWSRAVLHTQISNLEDTLIKVRRHEGSITINQKNEQIIVCGTAAARLHEKILGSTIDDKVAHFLVWIKRDSIQAAKREVDIELSTVHSHIYSLYQKWSDQLRREGPNLKVQKSALRKLNLVSDNIIKNRFTYGIAHKMKSFCILSPKYFLILAANFITRRG